jgi:glycosyltransferase involved in cell wall biosynthesis/ubiquinone/menaquinone biosynthesis C-methylase UbiE
MTVLLPATGERFLPESMSGEIAMEHQHRYHLVTDLAKGRDVLDVASGEGYGSALLAGVARSVIGVDLDANAVEFATEKYASRIPNIRFAAGSCSALPLADSSVDLVVSFETIEHHDEHEAMLAEIKRVLRPNGVLVISSPDRHEYSDVPGYRNPYHVKELYRDEFEVLLGKHFRSHRLYGQRVRHASTLFALEDHGSEDGGTANYLVDNKTGRVTQSANAIAPRYFVAVASDSAHLPALAVGMLTEQNEDRRIEELGLEIESTRESATAMRQQLAGLQNQNRAAADELNRLRQELEEWTKHAGQLKARADAQDAALRQLGDIHAQQLKETHELGLHQGARKAESAISHELSALRNALEYSDAQFQNSDAQYQNILRSLSWRITRPLRVARRLVTRLKSRPSISGVTVAQPDGRVDADDFDEKYYLRRYADVANAGIDPYQHFVMFGRPEGRLGLPPKLLLRETGKGVASGSSRRVVGSDAAHASGSESKRGTVLVVSHEATRTGAPILAWNICRVLCEQYHVVVLLLGTGPLVDMFDEVCDAVAGPYSPADRDPLALSPLISELCERYAFDFAVVNSIASRSVLQPLAEQYVPSTLLVHEFFKFHCSPDELVDAFAWAGQVVFSATIVQDSADIERTHPAALRAHVLPQGKSQIPGAASRNEQKGSGKDAVADRVARVDALQSKILGGRRRKPFIVIGAGTIEYRKGVDLFVATAAEIKRLAPDADILMVWVGGIVEGYKQYAEFVATQVEQSGLDEHIVFVSETPDLEALYRFADVCFISSRLDPLPNIAIDAVVAGLPVLSFEHATGVAENFRGDPQLEQCVVPFLDVDEAARRIIALHEAPAERQALSQRMTRLATERFDMSRYVAGLVEISEHGRGLVEQERDDVKALMDGGDFAEWFFLPPDSRTSRVEAIRQFVKSSQSGIYVRKPTPGFYPHKYAESHDLGMTQANPFVHFIAASKPPGVWQERLLDVSQTRHSTASSVMRIGIHVHAFYPDLLVDIVRRLTANDLRADLFVSVPSTAVAAECAEVLSGYRFGAQIIRVVPNRGRDLGPFVTEFGAELLKYDLIGHFHTKKSVHVDPRSNLVRNWVNHLMETLLGSQHRAAEAIVSAFAEDPQLGLVFADDPHLIGWDENLSFAKPLADKLGLSALPAQFFPFPVGTMFWARPVALKSLFELDLGWGDYPAEPLPIDGSMLHALERLLPSIVECAGFGRMVTYAPNITR